MAGTVLSGKVPRGRHAALFTRNPSILQQRSGRARCQERARAKENVKYLMSLEKLHGALVFLCRLLAVEGAEVAPLAGLWIFLARIKPIFA